MSETWKPISGYEDLYLVSDYGRVFGLERVNPHNGHVWKCRFLRFGKVGNYLQVHLCKAGKGRSFSVARLVAEAFIPNPDGKPQVNHKDLDTRNNCATNLEWVTRIENIRHAIKNGRWPNQRGARNPSSKLRDDQVLDIRRRLIAGEFQQSIATRYRISQSIVSRIKSKKAWTSVT